MHTAIMYSSPPHVPLEFPLERTPSRPMHDASIIPHNQIPISLPLNTDNIPLRTSMPIQPLNQLPGLFLAQTFNMMYM